MRELRDLAARDVLDIQIVIAVAHPPDASAVRRELREHERGRRPRAAEFLERPARKIEHPVVAARVLPPHRLRIREDQQAPAVRRPAVLFDVERGRVTGWHEPRRRHENRLETGLDIVAHDVASWSVAGMRFEYRVAAVVEPRQRAERSAAELGRAEDAIDGEERRITRSALGS